MKNKSEIVTDKIIKELDTWYGFDRWWGAMDEETKGKIKQGLQKIIIDSHGRET